MTMQEWSTPLRVFDILRRGLPDVEPTQYMRHLDELSRRVRCELVSIATSGESNSSDELDDAISHVFIKKSGHKILLKYMPTVQYGNLWNTYYRQCRGTVIDMVDMVAYHALDKFANVDEWPETSSVRLLSLAETEPYDVYNKFDGSLIMFYFNRGKWHTSTNGSFDSSQSQWAMEFARRTRLFTRFQPNFTYMFEAIYPENRIVVNYGDAERLVMLSARDVSTGQEWTPCNRAIDSVHDDTRVTLQQVLDSRDKYGATEKEGWVVYFPTQKLRVKIKCYDYVSVHKLKDRITPEGVFEMIRDDTLDDVRSLLPPDIRSEVDTIVRVYVDWERELRRKIDAIHVDDVTNKRATYMAVRDVVTQPFEQWYTLKCVRGEIDANESPLAYVKSFDNISHIFA